MKRFLLAATLLLTLTARASLPAETSAAETDQRTHPIDSVVVTGARYRADIRHLPMTVSTVDRRQIEQRHEQSLLPC